MRTTRESKFKKNCSRTKIKKKRNGIKNWFFPFGSHVSDKNIENINEVLRINKSVRCDSNGSWKLVPKDSCEVYRERRKRQQNQRRDGSLSEVHQPVPRQTKSYSGKGQKKEYKNAKRFKNKRRPRSESTMISDSDSHATKSSMSVCSSCASSSGMDY